MLSEISQKAKQIIGTAKSTDWILQPETHAENLPKEAGPLKRILERDEIKQIIKHYRQSDQDAEKYQKIYKKWGGAEIYLTLFATVIGAFFVLSLVWTEQTLLVKWFAIVVQFIILFLIFSISISLTVRKPFEKWMLYRGEAEIARIKFFDHITAASEQVKESELQLLPLQLEYFRRYHLNVQLDFYKVRGEQHKKASGQTNYIKWMKRLLLLLWAFIALFALLYALAALIGKENLPSVLKWLSSFELPENSENIVIFCGIIVSALHSKNMSRSLMNLDTRNAARYKVVYNNLSELTAQKLDITRNAAACDNKETVNEFMNDVNDKVSSEYKEWVILREHISPLTLTERHPILQGKIETMFGQ